jgi:oxygen-independent coproporphyrinogen-3 oxidase
MAGVYISYPFCEQKCTYCNFASGVMPAALEAAYLMALEREMDAHAWRWTPGTVYLGGGSPNRMSIEALERILTRIPGAPWKEATMEAAPGGITPGQSRAWRQLGINRVSLGVQSFVESELRRTGRRHNAEIVAKDAAMLAGAGISNINIDLIAGLPGQTSESWRESLAWIERLLPPHVSVYMLEVDGDSRLGREILEEGTRYGAREIPGDAAIAGMYETAVTELARLGIHRYEISNFARPGFESLHNLKYWRLEPYAGFGAGAHSFDGGTRWQNAETAAEYVGRDNPRVSESGAAGDERFFVGLRLSEGIRPEEAEWARYEAPIRRFLDAGLLERRGDRLRLTSRGILVSNEVFQEFLA